MEDKPDKKAMNSESAGRVYGKHSGFRKLKAYQVAELCYDFTCRFCERYIPFKDRHHDQMVQAARSGYQNISEGSEDSATTKKLEMNLTNVARSSIGELQKDYVKHLKRRHLNHWQQGDTLFEEARALRPQTLEEAVAWVQAGRTAKPRGTGGQPRGYPCRTGALADRALVGSASAGFRKNRRIFGAALQGADRAWAERGRRLKKEEQTKRTKQTERSHTV